MNAPDPIALSRARRQFQRGEAYLAANDPAAAANAFEAVLQELPGHVPALLKLSALHLMAGRYTPAEQLTLRALREPMESPGLTLQLIGQLQSLGQSRIVLDIASQLPPPMWDSANSLATVAQQLSRAGAYRMARGFARAAVERDGRHPPSLYMAANIEVFFGETERAVELLERALAIHPDLVDAHWLLSRLRQPGREARIARIESALRRVKPGEDEAFLAYALHNELHEARDWPGAWAALERACRAKRSTLNFSSAQDAALFAELRRWTAAEAASGDGYVDPTLTPVFVVGLHRSGTTLVERILGGHSRIAAAGETYELPTQLRRASGHYASGPVDLSIASARGRLDYRAIGQGYVEGMRWRSRERAWVSDKLPSNFLNLGFIARALPAAKIVHVRRNPVDVGLSTLRTLYTTACPYSYDQHEYIAHHREYTALMQHWHSVLPGRILDVDYEDVVADPPAAARRMAAFCGVDHEPAMTEIERSGDPVATASSVLVRDGIRRDRGRLWEPYAQWLQPLIETFGG